MDLIAKAVTLKSIRLHDSEANELLFSAKHAVLYQFNGSSWVKLVIIWSVYSHFARLKLIRKVAWQCTCVAMVVPS